MPVSLTVEASLPEPRMVRNHTAWRCRPRTEAGFPPHGQSPRMGATSQGANGSSAPLTIRVRVSVPCFRPALGINQEEQDAGFASVTLTSADQVLNDAATAEGRVVDDPSSYP